MAVKLDFHFPISTLEQESDLILTAAASDTYKAAIAERLDDGTVAQGRQLWTALFDPDAPPPPAGQTPASSAAQKAAHSAITDFTDQQKAAIKAYQLLVAKAHKAAAKAFKDNKTKLRDEFRIGIKPSKSPEKIVSEGRLLLTAVRNPANAPALKTKGGYIAKDTDQLEAALGNISTSEAGQEGAKGKAGGATDARNLLLNQLYGITLAIQGAAKNEYTDRQSLNDFRVGTFPPKEKGGDDKGDNPPTKPNNNPPPSGSKS